MHRLQLTDLGDGRLQVSWQREMNEFRNSQPIPFVDPLSEEDRHELRWYLEEYLEFPYGAERYRAQKVEEKMKAWGESLFTQVFAKDVGEPNPLTMYQEAVREGLEKCELCVSSDNGPFLNIPWELTRDPAKGGGYLAPRLGAFFRHHSGHRIQAPIESVTKPFRVLLVVSRPFGKQDIPLGTVARPLLDVLRPFRPSVQLEVLRPPTFDALQSRLNTRRGEYQLVHFDGHGSFVHDSSSVLPRYGEAIERGVLVFEDKDGSPRLVNSDDLAQLLSTSKVPLFVLNACKSAEEGKRDAFSSVASQLVAIGAKGVVAMSYSVYAKTASLFMKIFYENLVKHASLAEAVALGRRTLYADPARDSIVGKMDLLDWIVPVLYQQQQQYVPISTDLTKPATSETGMQIEERCPQGLYGFVGRDYDILRIERTFYGDANPWTLLTGVGGVGKTELAYGFARWFWDTSGCPGGVFVTSFKTKADFGQVVGSILGYATDYSRLPEEEQWKYMVKYLRENACLLIWDNFETVNGYPSGAKPFATDEDRDKLSRFLKALRGGKSRALITTRKPDERWLDIAYNLLPLEGLIVREAGQLAEAILKTIGRAPKQYRDDPSYADLIRLLNGHPRSLEVVLPHLREKSPREIIEAIQERVNSLGESLEDASLTYAFLQMPTQTRRHLPFIGLFSSYVHADMLSGFVGVGGAEESAYKDAIGEVLDSKGWNSVLAGANQNGLLRLIGSGTYELHPTLPLFLRRQLAMKIGEDSLKRLDSAFTKFYAAFAAACHDVLEKGNVNLAHAFVVEEANILRALRLAENNEDWPNIDAIARTIRVFYGDKGRLTEWSSHRLRLINSIGRTISADADRDKAVLWMFLLGDEANEAIERNDLETAESAHQRIISYLLSLHDTSAEPNVAVGYHQLGIIAQERQRFDEAEEWYRKALEIFERLKLERYAASDYHQLGTIAQERQRLDEAEEWYRKALHIREPSKLERDAASDYYQLGIIAQERQRLDEAEEWYRKSLEICERLKLERYAALGYHQLGTIAQERQRLDEAEEWYRKSLEIFERLKLERDAASDYHQLGIIAQERQRFDEAEGWYRKALEIREGSGHLPSGVQTLAQLGLLYRERGNLHEAVSYLGKALAIAAKYKMRVGAMILVDLARVMKDMGEKEFDAAWRQCFKDQASPVEILSDIISKLGDKKKET